MESKAAAMDELTDKPRPKNLELVQGIALLCIFQPFQSCCNTPNLSHVCTKPISFFVLSCAKKKKKKCMEEHDEANGQPEVSCFYLFFSIIKRWPVSVYCLCGVVFSGCSSIWYTIYVCCFVYLSIWYSIDQFTYLWILEQASIFFLSIVQRKFLCRT